MSTGTEMGTSDVRYAEEMINNTVVYMIDVRCQIIIRGLDLHQHSSLLFLHSGADTPKAPEEETGSTSLHTSVTPLSLLILSLLRLSHYTLNSRSVPLPTLSGLLHPLYSFPTALTALLPSHHSSLPHSLTPHPLSHTL